MPSVTIILQVLFYHLGSIIISGEEVICWVRFVRCRLPHVQQILASQATSVGQGRGRSCSVPPCGSSGAEDLVLPHLSDIQEVFSSPCHDPWGLLYGAGRTSPWRSQLLFESVHLQSLRNKVLTNFWKRLLEDVDLHLLLTTFWQKPF